MYTAKPEGGGRGEGGGLSYRGEKSQGTPPFWMKYSIIRVLPMPSEGVQWLHIHNGRSAGEQYYNQSQWNIKGQK
jgi:hypothetical protein